MKLMGEGSSARHADRTGRRAGFTLIEVLVVVAIIALLISILLPSLKKARDQAKITACLGNLHDFGLASIQYTMSYNSYYPLVPYIGSSLYYDLPFADDNLFVLYYTKMVPNVQTFTCPATNHKVRKPWKIERIRKSKGTRFEIYCDPEKNEPRNDFEFHAQMDRQLMKDHGNKVVQVNGYGSSYEYGGWTIEYYDPGTDKLPKYSTLIDWYPFNRMSKGTTPGRPKKMGNIKFPSTSTLMKDADEGGTRPGEVVNSSKAAENNVPEPWDNHGSWAANVLHDDGSAITRNEGYWRVKAKERKGIPIVP